MIACKTTKRGQEKINGLTSQVWEALMLQDRENKIWTGRIDLIEGSPLVLGVKLKVVNNERRRGR